MKKYITSERELARRRGADLTELQNRIAKREARIDEFRQKQNSYTKALDEFRETASAEFQKVMQPWKDKIDAIGFGSITTRLTIDDYYDAGHRVCIHIGCSAPIGGGYEHGFRRQTFGWEYSFFLSSRDNYENKSNNCGWQYVEMIDNNHMAILQFSAEFIQFINAFDWKSFMYAVLQKCPDYNTIVDIPWPGDDPEYLDPSRDIHFVLPELEKTIGKDVWIVESSSHYRKILSISDNTITYVNLNYYGDYGDKMHNASRRLISQIESGNFENISIYNSAYLDVKERGIVDEIKMGHFNLPLNLITQEELIENIQQLAAGN